jgi:hypothetical protein
MLQMMASSKKFGPTSKSVGLTSNTSAIQHYIYITLASLDRCVCRPHTKLLVLPRKKLVSTEKKLGLTY